MSLKTMYISTYVGGKGMGFYWAVHSNSGTDYSCLGVASSVVNQGTL